MPTNSSKQIVNLVADSVRHEIWLILPSAFQQVLFEQVIDPALVSGLICGQTVQLTDQGKINSLLQATLNTYNRFWPLFQDALAHRVEVKGCNVNFKFPNGQIHTALVVESPPTMLQSIPTENNFVSLSLANMPNQT